MMRISDMFDDDGIDECDLNLKCDDKKDATEKFKESYGEYYDDVKKDVREDW